MSASRRQILNSSAILLGSQLLEMLATPLWRWTGTTVIHAASLQDLTTAPAVTFVDVAQSAGLTVPNVWGGVQSKKYIIEGKGSGLAFFDYDNDGWLDIYLTNGIRFGETYTPQNAPTSHLYKNNRDGTFSDVTARSGLARTGWGTGGMCRGL